MGPFRPGNTARTQGGSARSRPRNGVSRFISGRWRGRRGVCWSRSWGWDIGGSRRWGWAVRRAWSWRVRRRWGWRVGWRWGRCRHVGRRRARRCAWLGRPQAWRAGRRRDHDHALAGRRQHGANYRPESAVRRRCWSWSAIGRRARADLRGWSLVHCDSRGMDGTRVAATEVHDREHDDQHDERKTGRHFSGRKYGFDRKP